MDSFDAIEALVHEVESLGRPNAPEFVRWVHGVSVHRGLYDRALRWRVCFIVYSPSYGTVEISGTGSTGEAALADVSPNLRGYTRDMRRKLEAGSASPISM